MEFKTTDLYEAAFFYASGIKIKRLDGTPQQSWFIFDTDKGEEMALNYWNRETKVDAKTYAEAIRNCKDLLFARGRVTQHEN